VLETFFKILASGAKQCNVLSRVTASIRRLDFRRLDEPTGDFTYARLMGSQEKVKTGYKPAELDRWAKLAAKVA